MSTNKEYYDKIMKFSYKELVEFLQEKYGKATCDFFVNETCRSKGSKISRTKEGLFCHHVDEDKAIMLSTPEFALRNPFDYQKKDRLVYCNYLEHFLLHILIAEEPRNPKANPNELVGIGGAVNFIGPELNDMYEGREPTIPWKINVWNLVKDDYESYLLMLKRLLNLLNTRRIYDHVLDNKKQMYIQISKRYKDSCSNEKMLSLSRECRFCRKIYDDLTK